MSTMTGGSDFRCHDHAWYGLGPCPSCILKATDGPALNETMVEKLKNTAVQGKPEAITIQEGYYPLFEVFRRALDQAQNGKGRERHERGTGKPFLRQPMLEISRMVGVGGLLYQAMKKAQEAGSLPADRAEAELLGAINYLAGAILLIREGGEGEK